MSTQALLCCTLFLVFLNSVGNALKRANLAIDTRIVGGDEVDIKRCPYQVSIQYFGMHFCGGALISRDTVLTAAHCFGGKSYPQVISGYKIQVGSNTTNNGQSITIKSVLAHSNYSTETLDFDIALLKLGQNVTISETVQLVKISKKDDYLAGTLATVSGWGYQQENGTVSSLLRKVDVPLTSRKECQEDYADLINITLNMICAGLLEGGKDACQGDSGGPLVQNNRLIGVVSFGMGCARKSYPGVYTNVARFVDWITGNTSEEEGGGGSNEEEEEIEKSGSTGVSDLPNTRGGLLLSVLPLIIAYVNV